MDNLIKTGADEILTDAALQIVQMYTQYALLLNGLDVTKKEYSGRQAVTLSTTQYIPDELRLPMEIDVQLKRDELIERYELTLPTYFCRNFVVDLVSHIDAWLEDIYELSLPVLDPSLDNETIEKFIRSAWTANNGIPAIRLFFLTKLKIQQPHKKITTPDMLFDRYEELREIRNAIIHSRGELTAKHVKKLTTLKARFPQSISGASTISDALVQNGLRIGSKINIDPINLLALRKWTFDFISYLQNSFTIS